MLKWLIENATADASKGLEAARDASQEPVRSELEKAIQAAQGSNDRKTSPKNVLPLPEFRLQVSTSELRRLFEKLEENFGKDIRMHGPAIYASANSAHLPILERIRERIFLRLSERAIEDAMYLTSLMRRIRLREVRR